MIREGSWLFLFGGRKPRDLLFSAMRRSALDPAYRSVAFDAAGAEGVTKGFGFRFRRRSRSIVPGGRSGVTHGQTSAGASVSDRDRAPLPPAMEIRCFFLIRDVCGLAFNVHDRQIVYSNGQIYKA